MTHSEKQSSIYSIVDVFRNLLRNLPRNRRRQFGWILLAMVFSGILETVAIGIVALFVSVIADPAAAIDSAYISKLHDWTQAEFLTNPQQLILFLSILVIGLVMFKNCIKALVSYTNALYSSLTATYLGERLFSGFLNVPYEWHLSKNSANLSLAVLWRIFISRLMDAFLGALSEVLMILMLVMAVIIVEPFISMIVIIVVGGSAFMIDLYIRKKIDRTARLNKDYQHMLNRDVSSAINAIKDVKIYTKQEAFISRFTRDAYTGAHLDAKQTFLGQCPQLILETIGFVLLGLTIIIVNYYMTASPARVMGLLSLLAVSAWRVLPGISKLLNRMSTVRIFIPYATNSLDYIDELLKEEPATLFPDQPKSIRLNHSLTFENISFSYRGAASDILKNITFTVPKGKTIGVIGRSGAGKSTLANLLIGLIAPGKGRILVDETPLDANCLESWMKMIGYIPQSAYILDGTLAENVAFGCKDDDINRERVMQSCRMAALDDLIGDLPNGIDTLVGDKGVKLSGGQQQRIAIARALYPSPEVMILDEATSSLDYKTEREIQQTIYDFKGKLTLIIIAHRLTTVEGCDEIIWLENGGILKMGKPEEILPEYRSLMASKIDFNGAETEPESFASISVR